MTIRIFLSLIVIISSFSAFATNIRVLDLQYVIENNTNISSLYEEIEKDQLVHKEKFNNEELNLEKEFNRIEKLNLILEPSA